MGYRDGAEDVRQFRRACAEGKVAPSPSLLLRSAMSEASPHYSRLAPDLSEASGIGRVDGGFRGGFSLRVGD